MLTKEDQFLSHDGKRVWACYVEPDPRNESRTRRLKKAGILILSYREATPALRRRGYTSIASMRLEGEYGLGREFSIDNHRLDLNSGAICIGEDGSAVYLFNDRNERDQFILRERERIEAERRSIVGAVVDNIHQTLPGVTGVTFE